MTAAPLRRALELAWEAFCAGSFPVGAVICDAAGAIVAEGRNRIGEATAPPGRLCNTGLAHAEIDALAELPMGDWEDHVLYTSLEPCLLCRSAITMAHVGRVEYLAADSLCDGLDRLREINGHAARRYPQLFGPGEGVEADFAAVLPMAVLLLFNRDGDTAAHYRRHSVRHAVAAQRVIDDDLWPPRHLDLDAAIEHLRPF